MASDSLAKSPSKLNRPRRQIALMQDLILAGSELAEALNAAGPKPLPQYALKALNRWSALMVKLVSTLF